MGRALLAGAKPCLCDQREQIEARSVYALALIRQPCFRRARSAAIRQRDHARDHHQPERADLFDDLFNRPKHALDNDHHHVPRAVSEQRSDCFEALEQQAAEEGLSVSAALADAAALWLATRRGLRAVRACEREHGALSAGELAAADRELDRVGVGRRSCHADHRCSRSDWSTTLVLSSLQRRTTDTSRAIQRGVLPVVPKLLASAAHRRIQLIDI